MDAFSVESDPSKFKERVCVPPAAAEAPCAPSGSQRLAHASGCGTKRLARCWGEPRPAV